MFRYAVVTLALATLSMPVAGQEELSCHANGLERLAGDWILEEYTIDSPMESFGSVERQASIELIGPGQISWPLVPENTGVMVATFDETGGTLQSFGPEGEPYIEPIEISIEHCFESPERDIVHWVEEFAIQYPNPQDATQMIAIEMRHEHHAGEDANVEVVQTRNPLAAGEYITSVIVTSVRID